MPLMIATVKNHLPTSRSPFVVRSNRSEVVEFDRLVEILAASRTTVSRADIVAVMQLYKEELRKQLAEGRTVKTPTGSFYMSAAGSVDSPDEPYLPRDGANNHDVRLHHRPLRAFEDSIVADLTFAREEKVDLSVPSLLAATAAGEDSGLIRSGGLVRIKGHRLRLNPKAEDQGVFFVDAGGVQSRSRFYPTIQPGTVLAGVPEGLALGRYVLVLRAAVNGRDVREGRLEGLVISA